MMIASALTVDMSAIVMVVIVLSVLVRYVIIRRIAWLV
jgi:hypothetical protein